MEEYEPDFSESLEIQDPAKFIGEPLWYAGPIQDTVSPIVVYLRHGFFSYHHVMIFVLKPSFNGYNKAVNCSRFGNVSEYL